MLIIKDARISKINVRNDAKCPDGGDGDKVPRRSIKGKKKREKDNKMNGEDHEKTR